MSALPAHPLLPTPCRVRRVVRETHDTFTLELDVQPRPTFRPGQFAMLYVFGVGEAPISFSGQPSAERPITHTTREVGVVTQAMGRLRRGASLGIRGPYGRPWPLDEARGRDVLLVAGGIGLAPLRSAIYEIATRRKEFGRVVLLYGARGPAELLFGRELARWQATSRIEVSVTVDRGTRSWPGNVGVVTKLIPRSPIDPGSATALICGPEVMMRFAANALREKGLRQEQIYVSLERNMKCAVGLCGRCQLGPSFVCKDGPVFPYDRVKRLLELREI
jgi:NAD(P)H-flavin reductase